MHYFHTLILTVIANPDHKGKINEQGDASRPIVSTFLLILQVQLSTQIALVMQLKKNIIFAYSRSTSLVVTLPFHYYDQPENGNFTLKLRENIYILKFIVTVVTNYTI